MKTLTKNLPDQRLRSLAFLLLCCMFMPALSFGQTTELKKGYGMQDEYISKVKRTEVPADKNFQKGYGMQDESITKAKRAEVPADNNLQKGYGMQDSRDEGGNNMLAPIVVPANDLCQNAAPISCNTTVSGTTIDATFDDVGICGTANTAPGVWYTFVGSGGIATVSTCNYANFDTRLSVFTGTCENLVCVTGNDDFCGLQSEVTFLALQGETYYILVHGFGLAIGDFDLTLSCIANDFCSSAELISCNSTVSGTTIHATFDDVGICVTANTAPGVWYTFVGSGGMAYASTCNYASFDTRLSVFTGTCENLVCVTGNDDFCGLQSEVAFLALQGETYYILVHGFGLAIGDFDLTLSCIANDFCSDAELISCNSTVSGTTIQATFDDVGICVTANTAPGVWYKFVGSGGMATVSTCNFANFDTKLSVFTGTCENLVCVTGNDDFCGLHSEVAFFTSQGETYYILVHGFGLAIGDFDLTLSCSPPSIPVSNWAIMLGIFLIAAFMVIRFRRILG